MNWTELDWAALDRLRARFLSPSPSDEPYWESESALASYDLTYGERIGWKWDQVLVELDMRGWKPGIGGGGPQADALQKVTVLDWGCGSGVASRRVIAKYGADRFRELVLWDHSPLAVEYARRRAEAAFPGFPVSQATASFLESDAPIDLLVISHVLNELPDDALAALKRVVARSAGVLWVEAGTSEVSRALGRIRDELLARRPQADPLRWEVVAPCTHQLACPMFAGGNERHWCHFFAPPPAGIFADGNWVKFGQRAGIDLRSLPYSFLALQSGDWRLSIGGQEEPDRQSAIGNRQFSARIIGRPEHFKPYVRFLKCDEGGLTQVEVPKRQDPELYKTLERTRKPLVLDSRGRV